MSRKKKAHDRSTLYFATIHSRYEITSKERDGRGKYTPSYSLYFKYDR